MRRIEAAVLVMGAALAAPVAMAEFGPIPLEPDANFGIGGVSRADLPPEFIPRRIHVAADASIYTLTAEQAGAGESVYYLTRRDAQGALDATFDGDGVVVHDDGALAGTQVYLGMCEDPDTGALYVTGATEGEEGVIVRRFLANGAVDDSWGTDGLLTVPMAGDPQPYAQGCALQDDGKLVLVGSWSALNADAVGVFNQAFVARVTTAGALDNSFAGDGVFAFVPPSFLPVQLYHALTHVAIDVNGNLYVAGHAIDPRNFSRDMILSKLTTVGDYARPYGNGGALLLPAGPPDEQIAGIRINSGSRLVVGLLHTPANGDPGYEVTAMRFNIRGEIDPTYGCAGFKKGPVELGALAPFAAAFDGSGQALFLTREDGADEYESVLRTSGLPELGIGGSSGEEIAHGCPSTDVLTRNIGGGSTPAGLLAVFGLASLLRRARRR